MDPYLRLRQDHPKDKQHLDLVVEREPAGTKSWVSLVQIAQAMETPPRSAAYLIPWHSFIFFNPGPFPPTKTQMCPKQTRPR